MVGGPARLDSVIRERRRPARRAQHLLTAIALSAQPPTAAVAAAAARLGSDVRDELRSLIAGRLVRTHEGADAQELEPYHDRIREAIADGLDVSASTTWHAKLAGAWEASGAARPEALVTHFRGAGNLASTTRYATIAADAAEHALAFQRAAHYYRLLLDVDDPAQRSRWQTRLGDALANGTWTGSCDGVSRCTERCDARHGDRTGAPRGRAADSRRLPGSGVQGPELLAASNWHRPARTDAGAFLGLVVRRLALAVRGAGFHERHERDVPLTACVASTCCGRSACSISKWNLRGQQPPPAWHASGAALGGSGASSGAVDAGVFIGDSRRPRRSSCDQYSRTGEAGGRASRRPGVAGPDGMAEAICHKVVGRWALARRISNRQSSNWFRSPACAGKWRRLMRSLHDTLFWMGDWKRLFNEMPARRQEAEDCGDLYSATHVAVRLTAIRHLAADEPDRARVEAAAGMARWPSQRFDLQHRWEVCSLLEADLYSGRAVDAWDRLQAAWPRLRWTMHAFQNARIEMRFFRARIALARAADGEPGYLRSGGRCRTARRRRCRMGDGLPGSCEPV